MMSNIIFETIIWTIGIDKCTKRNFKEYEMYAVCHITSQNNMVCFPYDKNKFK